MRTIIFFLLLVDGLTLKAQSTRTSIANGNFTNPATWDCGCVPIDGDDIQINHYVTFDVDFTLNSGTISVNEPSGQILAHTTPKSLTINGGTFYNERYAFFENVTHSGGSFINSGWTGSGSGTLIVYNNFKSITNAYTQNGGSMSVFDSLYIDTNASLLNESVINYMTHIINSGTITNQGSISGDDFYNSGTYTGTGTWGVGYGQVTANNIYNTGTISNGYSLVAFNEFHNSGILSNTNSSSDIFSNKFFNIGILPTDTVELTNDGEIKVQYYFINDGLMDGNGSYCIGDSSLNSGMVQGNLTFCDSSGLVFDVNTGTIDPSVTFCSSPCQVLILGAQENVTTNSISVYPNPFSNLVNFELDENSTYTLIVLNSIGETVFTNSFGSDRYIMDASAFVPGMYFYRISGNNKIVSGTLIK